MSDRDIVQRLVHNHGPEDGPGVACHESLIGDCVREAADAEIRRLRKREARCQRVCFGAEVKGLRSWVSQEYADRLRSERDEAVEALEKVVAYMDRLATRSAAQADEYSRFPSLAHACRADAQNWRATAKSLRTTLAKIKCASRPTPSFSVEDSEQFAQLIGYSLSGFGELSYVTDETYNAAAGMVDGADERDARIAALEETLATVRRGLHIAAPAVFRIHPDDLRPNEEATHED
ncbi:MAG: hypothetical protein AMXMBFR53_30230 [Gemmatimonadota bacterium]